MRVDRLWTYVDAERSSLADLLDGLTPEQWFTPSLCDGWTVRDVAAHITLSHARVTQIVPAMLRARLNFDRMVADTARQHPGGPRELSEQIRAMRGSHRRPPGTATLDPLMDMLVHGQDIAVPLGIRRPMPVAAAVAVGDHAWTRGFPLRARKRFEGVQFVADDAIFDRGTGYQVRGPMSAILMTLVGRDVGVGALSGDVDFVRRILAEQT